MWQLGKAVMTLLYLQPLLYPGLQGFLPVRACVRLLCLRLLRLRLLRFRLLHLLQANTEHKEALAQLQLAHDQGCTAKPLRGMIFEGEGGPGIRADCMAVRTMTGQH
jgi:hypothetical protein